MTSDDIIYLSGLGFLYLLFAALTAAVIYTMTVNDNDLNEEQRKITLARAVLASLLWPLFWVLALGYLFFRGVRFVLRYGFRSMEPRNHSGMSPLNAPQDKLDEADARVEKTLAQLRWMEKEDEANK